MLATARVLLLINVGETGAGRLGTPSDVVHGIDSGVKGELFILLNNLLGKSHSFNVQIVELLSTVSFSTNDLGNLVVRDEVRDHFLEAVGAKLVLTAGEEKEFIAHQISATYFTVMLFRFELAHESFLTGIERGLK